jgi:hypothetical protein
MFNAETEKKRLLILLLALHSFSPGMFEQPCHPGLRSSEAKKIIFQQSGREGPLARSQYEFFRKRATAKIFPPTSDKIQIK